jgi:hypothetical protein
MRERDKEKKMKQKTSFFLLDRLIKYCERLKLHLNAFFFSSSKCVRCVAFKKDKIQFVLMQCK